MTELAIDEGHLVSKTLPAIQLMSGEPKHHSLECQRIPLAA